MQKFRAKRLDEGRWHNTNKVSLDVFFSCEIEEGTIEMIEGPELNIIQEQKVDIRQLIETSLNMATDMQEYKDRIQELEEELAGTIATKHNDDAKIKKLEDELEEADYRAADAERAANS